MTFANEANFTCACLLVVNEILRSRADVRYSIFQHQLNKQEAEATKKTVMKTNEDSDEEVF